MMSVEKINCDENSIPLKLPENLLIQLGPSEEHMLRMKPPIKNFEGQTP